MGGGSSKGSEPTLQQQQLETQQGITTANLNLEENEQRKTILSGMNGTRVFRGSALSRAVAGNTPGSPTGGGPSPTQVRGASGGGLISATVRSLLDPTSASGATPAGGAGASGASSGAGSYAGGGGAGGRRP